MKAGGKSTEPREVRPVAAGLSAEQLQKVRAAALERAELRVFGGLRVTQARGLQKQLRAAGWIPAGIVIDEAVRQRLEWRDDAGRRCVLRPYGALQWEVARHRLPHEIQAERRAEADRQRARERAAAVERQRSLLQHKLRGLPSSGAQYRARVLHEADTLLGMLAWYAADRWPGCSLAADSLGALRDALAAVRDVLEHAAYHVEPGKAQVIRAELQQIEAREDAEFQAFMRLIRPDSDTRDAGDDSKRDGENDAAV
ncbi:hypothetical protein FBR04_19240 [Betaproteobacteria bacterium PRO7]|jgi:nuclear transport factor 2 (NTF2) superfamily protein|nr:hypothetical protein [Betaproteobacteria bacterium PRO7]